MHAAGASQILALAACITKNGVFIGFQTITTQEMIFDFEAIHRRSWTARNSKQGERRSWTILAC
jgi:hypothetical protein